MSNSKAAKEQWQLRQWTKDELTEDDLRFAVSGDKDRKSWACLAQRLWSCDRDAAKRAVADMLDWELFRELNIPQCAEFRRQPFLRVAEHRDHIERVLDKTSKVKPAQIEPLPEVPLADALKRNGELMSGLDAGVRVHAFEMVHAFEVEWDEDTDLTVQRFRNWLVAHKRGPDPRSRRALVRGNGDARLERRPPGVAEVRRALWRRGPLRCDAILCALAVRRLKESGYNREGAEQRLGLAKYTLNPLLSKGAGTNYWNKWPKLAKREIERFAEMVSRFYRPQEQISSP